MEFVGLHLLASLTKVRNLAILDDPMSLQKALELGIQRSGATALSWQSHKFEPQGCTVIALLAESHVTVHTYPEQGALFFDAFTCGEQCQPHLILEELRRAVGPSECSSDQLRRSGARGQLLELT